MMELRTVFSRPCLIVPVVFVVAVAAGACSKKSTSNGPSDISQLLADGWAAWESSQYSSSYDIFLDAVSHDPADAEARNGIGWAKLFLGELHSAIGSFDYAIYLELPTFDATLGMAFALRDSADYSNAVLNAQKIVDAMPRYTFSHRASINWKDIRLLIAQCSFRRGQQYFDIAQANVDTLDPTNGLDPESPASWVVGGVTYNAYPEALLKKIEALEAVIDP